MPYQYSDAELEAAGRALGQGFQNLNNQVEELKAKPYRDQLQAEWNAGRRAMQQQGWGAQDIANLENYMAQTGTASHQIAAKSFPYQPSTRGFLLNRLEADERQALENRDDETFLSLAVARALQDERGGW